MFRLRDHSKTFDEHQRLMADSTDPNKEYTFQSPRRQNFALPFSMMNLMMKTYFTPMVYQKLSQSCKSLYAKSVGRRILVVSCFIATSQYFSLSVEMLEEKQVKLWISKKIYCSYDIEETTSKFIKHIYRFDGDDLTLRHQNLTLD